MSCFALWCKCCYNTYSKLQYMICERDKIKNWQSLHFIYTFFLIVSIYGCFFLMFALLFVCIFCWQGFLLCIWIKQKCLRIYYIETPPQKKIPLKVGVITSFYDYRLGLLSIKQSFDFAYFNFSCSIYNNADILYIS